MKKKGTRNGHGRGHYLLRLNPNDPKEAIALAVARRYATTRKLKELLVNFLVALYKEQEARSLKKLENEWSKISGEE